MIDPIAMIIATSAQRRHLAGARLDGPVEPEPLERRHWLRRPLSAALIRAGRALEPAPCAAHQGRQLRSAGA
jgi:hypothetical protein